MGLQFSPWKHAFSQAVIVLQRPGHSISVNSLHTPLTMSGDSQAFHKAESDTPGQCTAPAHLNWQHQDSVFTNTFQARSNFVVHPEWLSEAVDSPRSIPMNRAPWPWEQPRYRVNLQIPPAYQAPEGPCTQLPEMNQDTEKLFPVFDGSSSTEVVAEDVSPITQATFRNYLFTHPSPLEGDALHHQQDICVTNS